MHAGKLLLLVVIGGAVLLTGVFAAVPSSRPPIVRKWFRSASGFTPATTPQEAVDRFKDCIKKRDYETAGELYCAGKYREQILRVAKKAKELGETIDSLASNMDSQGVNNPNTKYMLKLLEPFPKTFTVVKITETGNTAIAHLGRDEDDLKVDRPLPNDFVNKHGRLINSLVPFDYSGTPINVIPLIKDESGFWKVNFPVNERLMVSVEYLKENGTNYRNAIREVRDEVKNNPVTKEDIQTRMESALNKSK